MRMKPLILTCFVLSEFLKKDIADIAICPYFKFVWGQLPSHDERAAYFGRRTPDRGPSQGYHWSDYGGYWCKSKNRDYRDLGLADFCQRYETVELWYDTLPTSQLLLIWLLDYFRSHPEAVPKLKLRLLRFDLIGLTQELGDSRPPLVDVTERELATAQAAWEAYRAPTPEACFALLRKDLSALVLLRPVLLELLDELPSAVTGLGATETRMLELVGRGYSRTHDLFYLGSLRQTRVYDEWQYGYLLDGLALGPKPVISGLDDALRTLSREDYNARLDAYRRSRLSLTDFGRYVLAHKEDFSRHNPIDRWWGGTHLTNDNMWRYDPVLIPPARQ